MKSRVAKNLKNVLVSDPHPRTRDAVEEGRAQDQEADSPYSRVRVARATSEVGPSAERSQITVHRDRDRHPPGEPDDRTGARDAHANTRRVYNADLVATTRSVGHLCQLTGVCTRYILLYTQ